MTIDKMIQDFPQGLLNWYDFLKEGKVLCIGDEDSSITKILNEKCNDVIQVSVNSSLREEFQHRYRADFDYVIVVGKIEYLSNPVYALSSWRELLHEEGRMLLGMDNRLGLRYFCGDRDPFTDRSFDGIENYRSLLGVDREKLEGRNYSKEEIINLLEQSGWIHRKFYSVLPNLEVPQLIYAQDYLPAEELSIRFFPMYRHPDSVFLEEQFLYTDIIKNGMFHTIANSFLIECSKNNIFANIKHVTVSMDRGKDNAMATIIRNNNIVEKRALYAEGIDKLTGLKENEEDLRLHGLNVLEGTLENKSYYMPYVDSEIAMVYFRRLAKEDVGKFKEEVDKFRDFILRSSDHVAIDEERGILLKKGYIDLVPLNCFYDNGEYIFYDQEFYEENYPANVIIYRAIEVIYMNDPEMESILPRKYFYERYGLEENLELWIKLAAEFLYKLRNQRELGSFNQRFKGNTRVIHTNRQRINYSETEYQRIFVDLFRDAERKKIIVFGSGIFTKRFLAQFKKEYEIYAIVDNNQSKWGTQLEGIEITAPQLIDEIPKQECRVIICVKNYLAIIKQLQGMGVTDYCVYDRNVEYSRKKAVVIKKEDDAGSEPKKYRTGYIAGVFDLFHIGHLNMFKRAKEQCDYLIVGIVTDEGVRKNKKTEPFIPLKERIEIVRACKYVDEAVEIPLDSAGTEDAYKMYHFDCQFSGSDYVNNPDWLGSKTFLEKQGVDMVFFPYTAGTSSTKLKGIIEKSLL